jgi:hypothetical protein
MYRAVCVPIHAIGAELVMIDHRIRYLVLLRAWKIGILVPFCLAAS